MASTRFSKTARPQPVRASTKSVRPSIHSVRSVRSRNPRFTQFANGDDDDFNDDELTLTADIPDPGQSLQVNISSPPAQQQQQAPRRGRSRIGAATAAAEAVSDDLSEELKEQEQSLVQQASHLAHYDTAVLWTALKLRSPASLAAAKLHKTPAGGIVPLKQHLERSDASRAAYTSGVRCRKPDCTQFMSCSDPRSVIDTACAEAKEFKLQLARDGVPKNDVPSRVEDFMQENADRFARDKALALQRRAQQQAQRSRR